MFIHHRAARGGLYYFASTIDPRGGVTVWLVAWLGLPLPWATIGHVDRHVRRDLQRQGLNPVELLIDNLIA